MTATAGEPPPIFRQDQLDRCMSCGFCLPACPTYELTADETSSPRGRIALMRLLQRGELAADDPTAVEQASFCLGCRACESACPAGVEYGDLLEQWRARQWSGLRRPFPARLLMLAASAGWAHRLGGFVRRAASTGLAGPHAGQHAPSLMLGCFERSLFPRVSRAARALAPELIAPTRQGCCGALHAHNGKPSSGRAMARRLGDQLPGTIVTTSGGCAAHLRAVLGPERVAELSVYLQDKYAQHQAAGEVRIGSRRARVTIQDSCHLRHGLRVWREPRALLESVADLVEIHGAARCCGAAGTYSLLRPADSRQLLETKLDEIESADVDFVVVVNPGCLRQLRGGLRRRHSRVRALHIAELLLLARQGRKTRTVTQPGRKRTEPRSDDADLSAP